MVKEKETKDNSEVFGLTILWLVIPLKEIGNNREGKIWEVRAKIAQIKNSFEHVNFEVSIIHSRKDVQCAVKYMNPRIPVLVGAEKYRFQNHKHIDELGEN